MEAGGDGRWSCTRRLAAHARGAHTTTCGPGVPLPPRCRCRCRRDRQPASRLRQPRHNGASRRHEREKPLCRGHAACTPAWNRLPEQARAPCGALRVRTTARPTEAHALPVCSSCISGCVCASASARRGPAVRRFPGHRPEPAAAVAARRRVDRGPAVGLCDLGVRARAGYKPRYRRQPRDASRRLRGLARRQGLLRRGPSDTVANTPVVRRAAGALAAARKCPAAGQPPPRRRDHAPAARTPPALLHSTHAPALHPLSRPPH